MGKTKPVICESERRFLELAGDGTELVKITSLSRNLSGWYLYLREDSGRNKFLRSGKEGLLERIFCETRYLQFDSNLGILPDALHEHYSPAGPLVRSEEYK